MHPGLSDSNHLVSTCSGRSTVHGGPCATQGSGGAAVRIPGFPLCVHYSHRCSQQHSHSANANLVFSHPASPSRRQRLAKISVFAEINRALQKLPASHTIPEDQSDPSQRGLLRNVQCFATSFELVCFKRCAEEGGAGTNGVSSVLEEM